MTRVEDPPYIAGATRVILYDEVEEILKSRDFAAGKFEQESLPFRGETVIELDGDEHLDRRRLEAPLFSRSALLYYETEVLERSIQRCIQERVALRDPDGVVRADLTELTRRMLLQIAAATIGLDDVETPERTTLLERYMYPLNDAVDVKWSTRDHADVVRDGLIAKEAFLSAFYVPSESRRRTLVGAYREGRIEQDDLPIDLITLMLLQHQPGWDDDLMAREAILFLDGATLTTSNAVTHAVLELLEWLPAHPEDQGSVTDDEFLRGVCNETLRLHPNITALVRRATRPMVLRTGRAIGSGEVVALNIVQANRDPAVFGADAEQFDPRRTVEQRVRPYGFAFGAGRHVCIGRPMVTSVSGKVEHGEPDRVMLKILKALLRHGVARDTSRPAILAETVEEVYEVLPVRFDRL